MVSTLLLVLFKLTTKTMPMKICEISETTNNFLYDINSRTMKLKWSSSDHYYYSLAKTNLKWQWIIQIASNIWIIQEKMLKYFFVFWKIKILTPKIFWYHLLDLIQMWSIDVNFFEILTYQSNLYQVEITQFMRKKWKNFRKTKIWNFFVVEFFLVSTKNQQITQKIKEKNKT